MFLKLPNNKNLEKVPRWFTSIEHTWEQEFSFHMKLGMMQQVLYITGKMWVIPSNTLEVTYAFMLWKSQLSFLYPLWIYKVFYTFIHISISSMLPFSDHFLHAQFVVLLEYLYGSPFGSLVYTRPAKWMQRQTWLTIANLVYHLFVWNLNDCSLVACV